MNLIAAVDNKWAIGCNNKLLANIPEDMKFFRRKTTGKVVVMGRRTLESFPNKRPLRDRINIVLTQNKSYKVPNATVVNSVEELKEELEKYNSDDIFIIGGESIYRLLLDWCDTAYLTKIDYSFSADAFFPNLDENKNWKMVKKSEEQTCFDLEYYFTKYKNKDKM